MIMDVPLCFNIISQHYSKPQLKLRACQPPTSTLSEHLSWLAGKHKQKELPCLCGKFITQSKYEFKKVKTYFLCGMVALKYFFFKLESTALSKHLLNHIIIKAEKKVIKVLDVFKHILKNE